MRKICNFIPTSSYTKAYQKVGEVSQITLVRFKYKRETKSELKEMRACLLFWKSCKKLQVQRKGNEWCSPSSCSEDQYSKMKVLATRNPRYEESIEIILIHSLSSWILDFAWSAGSIPTLFARDEQSLGVGVCWRSISMIFTANISPEFMIWGPTQTKSDLY